MASRSIRLTGDARCRAARKRLLPSANGVVAAVLAMLALMSSELVAATEAETSAQTGWKVVAPMPTARYRLAAATGGDGRIYAIGGNNNCGESSCNFGYVSTVEAYDVNADTWVARTSMPTPRADAGAATGRDGRIYVVGGATGTNPGVLDTLEVYDPATNSWTTSDERVRLPEGARRPAPMPTARFRVAAAADRDGRIYALGGVDSNGVVRNTVERYDPNTNTWSTITPMSTPRDGMAATTGPDGRIYAIGGSTLPTVEAFDPSGQVWAPVAPMSTPRDLGAAATGADGRIYALAGINGWLTTPQASVEAYDPGVPGNWEPAPSLALPRYGLAAAIGRNKRIYAIGGFSNQRVLNSVEAYTTR